jgi:hypothetical protein
LLAPRDVITQTIGNIRAVSRLVWSPDGRSIGFFADGKLKRVDVEGGVRTLANALSPRGGTWNQQWTLLFAPSGNTALLRVSLDGGDTRPATELGTALRHRFPSLLPDGDRILYWSGGADSGQVHVGSLTARSATPVVTARGSATYLAPDALLFEDSGTPYGPRLDLREMRLIGDRVTIASGVGPGQESL